jgi:hypothetical protein
MVVLAVSDKVSESLYSSPDPDGDRAFDAILSCGDLRPGYLDFLSSRFNAPLFYVRGNHANFVEADSGGKKITAINGQNLHLGSARFRGLTLAGIEGCVRYNPGTFQYSQRRMWLHAIRLVPALVANRLRYGRYLDTERFNLLKAFSFVRASMTSFYRVRRYRTSRACCTWWVSFPRNTS